MTEKKKKKWGKIQGKLNFVRVGGDFELAGFYSNCITEILLENVIEIIL